MSSKSTRKPAKQTVAESSIEELKLEVSKTRDIFLLIRDGSFAGGKADHVLMALQYLDGLNLAAVSRLKKAAPHLFPETKAEAPPQAVSAPEPQPESAE